MFSDFSPRKRGNFKIMFFFGPLEKGNFKIRLFFEHLEKGQPQAPLLLLLTALNRHANPNAVNVIDAKISIPTGHPQLKKA